MVITISSRASRFLGVAEEIILEGRLTGILDPDRHWRDASTEVGLEKGVQPRVYLSTVPPEVALFGTRALPTRRHRVLKH